MENIIYNYYIKRDKVLNIYNKTTLVIKYDNQFRVQVGNSEYIWDIFVNINKKILIDIDNIVFLFDFSKEILSIKQADKLIIKIKALGNILKNKRNLIGIKEEDKNIVGNVIKGKSEYEANVLSAIGVLLCDSKRDKYNYLYDEICEYLDNKVVEKNICEFNDDKCIAKKNTNCTMGCCHHYKNKYFGILYEKDLHLCEYQKDKKCSAKCLTCKMYMCDYLIKKGVRFTNRNVLLIKEYFNPIQKLIIRINFFTPKEKILRWLLLFSVR